MLEIEDMCMPVKVLIEKLRGGRVLWKIFEILPGFGPVGNTEKKLGPIMSNFWERFFNECFQVQNKSLNLKKIYFSGTKKLHKMKIRKKKS